MSGRIDMKERKGYDSIGRWVVGHTRWPWPLTPPMTLILDFQGQIFKYLVFRNGWVWIHEYIQAVNSGVGKNENIDVYFIMLLVSWDYFILSMIYRVKTTGLVKQGAGFEMELGQNWNSLELKPMELGLIFWRFAGVSRVGVVILALD